MEDISLELNTAANTLGDIKIGIQKWRYELFAVKIDKDAVIENSDVIKAKLRVPPAKKQSPASHRIPCSVCRREEAGGTKSGRDNWNVFLAWKLDM